MNDLDIKKGMNILDIANFTGRDRETVRAHIEKMYPELLKNGIKTFLDEKQASDILKSLRTKDVPNLQKNLQVLTKVDEDKIINQAYVLLQKREQENLKIIDNLKKQNQIMIPKSEFYDAVTGSDDTQDMRNVAALLNIPGYGRNTIFKVLRDQKILDKDNIPFRLYQDREYFRVVESKYTDAFGETRISIKTVVYQKGIDFIRNIINEEYNKANGA